MGSGTQNIGAVPPPQPRPQLVNLGKRFEMFKKKADLGEKLVIMETKNRK